MSELGILLAIGAAAGGAWYWHKHVREDDQLRLEVQLTDRPSSPVPSSSLPFLNGLGDAESPDLSESDSDSDTGTETDINTDADADADEVVLHEDSEDTVEMLDDDFLDDVSELLEAEELHDLESDDEMSVPSVISDAGIGSDEAADLFEELEDEVDEKLLLATQNPTLFYEQNGYTKMDGKKLTGEVISQYEYHVTVTNANQEEIENACTGELEHVSGLRLDQFEIGKRPYPHSHNGGWYRRCKGVTFTKTTTVKDTRFVVYNAWKACEDNVECFGVSMYVREETVQIGTREVDNYNLPPCLPSMYRVSADPRLGPSGIGRGRTTCGGMWQPPCRPGDTGRAPPPPPPGCVAELVSNPNLQDSVPIQEKRKVYTFELFKSKGVSASTHSGYTTFVKPSVSAYEWLPGKITPYYENWVLAQPGQHGGRYLSLSEALSNCNEANDCGGVLKQERRRDNMKLYILFPTDHHLSDGEPSTEFIFHGVHRKDFKRAFTSNGYVVRDGFGFDESGRIDAFSDPVTAWLRCEAAPNCQAVWFNSLARDGLPFSLSPIGQTPQRKPANADIELVSFLKRDLDFGRLQDWFKSMDFSVKRNFFVTNRSNTSYDYAEQARRACALTLDCTGITHITDSTTSDYGRFYLCSGTAVRQQNGRNSYIKGREFLKQNGYVHIQGLALDNRAWPGQPTAIDAKRECDKHPDCVGFTHDVWVKGTKPGRGPYLLSRLPAGEWGPFTQGASVKIRKEIDGEKTVEVHGRTDAYFKVGRFYGSEARGMYLKDWTPNGEHGWNSLVDAIISCERFGNQCGGIHKMRNGQYATSSSRVKGRGHSNESAYLKRQSGNTVEGYGPMRVYTEFEGVEHVGLPNNHPDNRNWFDTFEEAVWKCNALGNFVTTYETSGGLFSSRRAWLKGCTGVQRYANGKYRVFRERASRSASQQRQERSGNMLHHGGYMPAKPVPSGYDRAVWLKLPLAPGVFD